MRERGDRSTRIVRIDHGELISAVVMFAYCFSNILQELIRLECRKYIPALSVTRCLTSLKTSGFIINLSRQNPTDPIIITGNTPVMII